MLKAFKTILVFSLILGTIPAHAAYTWQKIPTNLTDTDLRAIAINPSTASSIYTGSANALYHSTNAGQDFKAVLTPTGEGKTIHQIYISPEDPNRVYAATDAGLFESANTGQSWERIYFSSDPDENKALCVIEDNGFIFLGTKRGLFFKNLSETNWHRIDGELNHKPIYLSAQDQTHIYFSTDEKLFRFDKKTRVFKLIFTVGFGRSNEDEESEDESENEEDEETSETKEHRNIKFLEVSPRQNLVFLCATNGIYLSKDQGQKWERLEAASVPVDQLTCLKVVSHGCPEGTLPCFSLLAVTTKGAFLYVHQRWQPVYQGMETNDIRYAALDNQGNIYAVTKRGLFLLVLEKALPSAGRLDQQNAGQSSLGDYKSLHQYFADEPTVREVHNLAIDYAEVHPDKIKDWREAAKKRAWLPTLSLGIDENRSWDTDDNFLTANTTIKEDRIGPDNKTFGHDLNWDATVSWDLADLIWNFSQTSIDTRSNAMIELREDILDQITRLYFERRRAQTELMNPAAADPQIRFDKEMRVEELTALIDAYTGGAFSEEIARRRAIREKIQEDTGHQTQDTR